MPYDMAMNDELSRRQFYSRAQQALDQYEHLRNSIEFALQWVEQAHRPPIADKLEAGRMVMIRLHALAALREAIETYE